MLEESLYQDKSSRQINEREKRLLSCLIKDFHEVQFDIGELSVIEMNDGGMGSLYIVHLDKKKEDRRMGKCIAEREFIDEDKIPISVTVNVDDDGDLFELDIWKANFNPIIKYPSCY